MGAPFGVEIDHKKHNKLDNRKSQLRISTHIQNAHNSKKQKRQTSSKFKGVYTPRDSRWMKKWRAYIDISPKNRLNLGCFNNEIEAAKAYNRSAKIHFGKFASLNSV